MGIVISRFVCNLEKHVCFICEKHFIVATELLEGKTPICPYCGAGSNNTDDDNLQDIDDSLGCLVISKEIDEEIITKDITKKIGLPGHYETCIDAIINHLAKEYKESNVKRIDIITCFDSVEHSYSINIGSSRIQLMDSENMNIEDMKKYIMMLKGKGYKVYYHFIRDFDFVMNRFPSPSYAERTYVYFRDRNILDGYSCTCAKKSSDKCLYFEYKNVFE